MSKFKTLIGGLLFAASISVMANPIAIATGNKSSGSTYSAMFNEFQPFCGNVEMVEIETSGSIENVALLAQNKTNAAIVQSDMLSYQKINDPKSVESIFTLVALHPEELHIIALKTPRTDSSFYSGWFGKNEFVEYHRVSDIKNKRIGAVGGSVLSANVISQYGALGLSVMEYKTNTDLLSAIETGEVDAGLVVAGSPHAGVASLNHNFKLLDIDDNILDALTGSDNAIYRKAVLSYNNLKQTGVKTVSVDALLVSRQYRSPRMITNLHNLRSCIIDNVYDLQDRLGTHPKWQAVDPKYKGKWNWYELPNNNTEM